jgi:hypothetical protein
MSITFSTGIDSPPATAKIPSARKRRASVEVCCRREISLSMKRWPWAVIASVLGDERE